MEFLYLSFTKIDISRKRLEPKKIKTVAKIHLRDIVDLNEELESGDKLLRFDFHYNINYIKNFAHINFTGEILAICDIEEAYEIKRAWKEKKIDKKVKLKVYNEIFQECNLKAFELEEDFGLPLHLKLPKIRSEIKKHVKIAQIRRKKRHRKAHGPLIVYTAQEY